MGSWVVGSGLWLRSICGLWGIQKGAYHGKSKAFIDAVVGAGVSLKESVARKPPRAAKGKKAKKAKKAEGEEGEAGEEGIGGTTDCTLLLPRLLSPA